MMKSLKVDINKLKLSYEWEWLRSKFNKLTK